MIDQYMERVDQAAEYLDGFLDDLSEAEIDALLIEVEGQAGIKAAFLKWRLSGIKEVLVMIRQDEEGGAS